MRRALQNQLPAFSALFGLHPWDVERLTLDELDVYRNYLDAQMRER